MKYDLTKGLPENFVYAASVRVPYRAAFQQAEGEINNVFETAPEGWDEYKYISAVAGKKVRLPVEMELVTSFDSFGAPLVIFSETLNRLEDGRLEYGEHYEAVLWEKGINLWYLPLDENKKQTSVNICRATASFPGGEFIRMRVKLTREGIEAQAGDLIATAKCSLPEEMYVGFTACEGENHFREFVVNEL